MKLIKQSLGKVSITVEKDCHTSTKAYDKLTVVEEGTLFRTYLSRKPVPIGIELTNREYWIPFSGTIEDGVIKTRNLADRCVTGIKIDINTIEESNLSESVRQKLNNTYGTVTWDDENIQ